MLTRSTNYESRNILHIFCVKHYIMTFKYQNIKVYLNDIQKLNLLNKIILFQLKNLNNLFQLQNSFNNEKVNCLLKSFLKKKNEFLIQIKELSQKPENNCESFKKASKILINRSCRVNKLINNYFNKNYSYILLKTNRDLYHNILSYL